MEKALVTRLASQVASGRLEIPSFFRACALAGISFATAMGAISETPAWDKQYAGQVSLPQAYSDFGASNVGVQKIAQPSPPTQGTSPVQPTRPESPQSRPVRS
jgi:hypothetical protein